MLPLCRFSSFPLVIIKKTPKKAVITPEAFRGLNFSFNKKYDKIVAKITLEFVSRAVLVAVVHC